MRNKGLLVVIVMCIFTNAFARKVKFTVDVTKHTITNTSGKMYVLLNSDGAATDANTPTVGYYTASNFKYTENAPAYIEMSQEQGTNIWSVVIDIPANKIYKYFFSDGAVGYGAETIPDESAAIFWGGGDQNYDNDTIANISSRWIYVDSVAKPKITSIAPKTTEQTTQYQYTLQLGTDTLSTQAILFGENAPNGKTLVRFKVNMRYQPISAGGVHLAGSFQNWDLNALPLASFNPLLNVFDETKTYQSFVYERIVFLDPGTYEYKFYQGNTSESSEIVPSACASTNGNRTITVGTTAMVLDTVCFSVCGFCSSVAKNTLTTVTSTPVLLSDYTYTLSNAPSGMLANKNVISWTPATGITSSGDVSVTVSNGIYSDTELFTIAVENTTAVDEISNTVNIYPIPCKDYAMLDFGSLNNDAEVTLYNSLGEPVKKYSIGNSTKLKIERTNLTSGIYYVIATSGGSVYVKSSLIFE